MLLEDEEVEVDGEEQVEEPTNYTQFAGPERDTREVARRPRKSVAPTPPPKPDVPTPPPKQPEVLRKKQLAEYFGVSVATIDLWRKAKRLPEPIVISPQYVAWRRTDIERLLVERTLQPVERRRPLLGVPGPGRKKRVERAPRIKGRGKVERAPRPVRRKRREGK